MCILTLASAVYIWVGPVTLAVLLQVVIHMYKSPSFQVVCALNPLYMYCGLSLYCPFLHPQIILFPCLEQAST